MKNLTHDRSIEFKNKVRGIGLLFTYLILAIALIGCGGNSQTPTTAGLPESPELAAREWLEAALDGDGEKLMERTCAAERTTVQELGILRQLVAWAGQELVGERGSGSAAETLFAVQSSGGDEALVAVTGEIISAVGAVGAVQPIDEVWQMRREGGRWRWCGLASTTSAAETAVKELQVAWTLPTGDIQRLMIAESGTIYGLITRYPWRHAVISPEGELLGVTEIDTEGRLKDSLIFGTGTNWVPQPDGALLIEGYGETAYLLPNGRMQFPNEPLRPMASGVHGGVSHAGATDAFRFYSIVDEVTDADGRSTGLHEFYELRRDRGPVLSAQVQLPNITSYAFLGEPERRARVVAYRLRDSGEIVVVSRTGAELFRGLPEGARADRFMTAHITTEWGDVWLRYTAVNEIGAALGERIARISETGQVAYFEQWPWDTYRNIVYLPNRDEILAYTQDGLFVLNRDLAEIDRYAAPPGNYPGRILIGFDGNLYVFNTAASMLTKFAR